VGGSGWRFSQIGENMTLNLEEAMSLEIALNDYLQSQPQFLKAVMDGTYADFPNDSHYGKLLLLLNKTKNMLHGSSVNYDLKRKPFHIIAASRAGEVL
jgi:hypothetical protein